MSPSDDNFDDLLRGHFAAELAPMRGQARRAFEREVTAPMRRRLRLRTLSGLTAKARQWVPLAATMAACTALGYFVPRLWTAGPTAGGTSVAASVVPGGKAGTGGGGVIPSNVFGSPALADYEQTRFEQHEDRGPAVLPDGTPGRRVRRTDVQAAQHVDPETHASTELYFFAPEADGVYSTARQ